MVLHKVNKTPPPWIHSTAANQTADELCWTRLCLCSYIITRTWTNCLQYYKCPWPTPGWRQTRSTSVSHYVHTCTHRGWRVCHIGQSPWATFTLQSLIHIDNRSIGTCALLCSGFLLHPFTVTKTKVSQSRTAPEWQQRKCAILRRPCGKEPFLPLFRGVQMRVSVRKPNDSSPALFCLVEASLCSKWGSLLLGMLLSQYLQSLYNP